MTVIPDPEDKALNDGLGVYCCGDTNSHSNLHGRLTRRLTIYYFLGCLSSDFFLNGATSCVVDVGYSRSLLLYTY